MLGYAHLGKYPHVHVSLMQLCMCYCKTSHCRPGPVRGVACGHASLPALPIPRVRQRFQVSPQIPRMQPAIHVLGPLMFAVQIELANLAPHRLRWIWENATLWCVAAPWSRPSSLPPPHWPRGPGPRPQVRRERDSALRGCCQMKGARITSKNKSLSIVLPHQLLDLGRQWSDTGVYTRVRVHIHVFDLDLYVDMATFMYKF